MQSKLSSQKPFILVLYGYPGSGKSTFARQIASEIKNTVHLNTDKVRSELEGELKKRSANDQALLTTLTEYMAKEFINSGFSVILDVPTYRKADRRRLITFSRNAKARLIMAWLQIDADSAFDRLKKQDKRKTSDKYVRNYTRSEFESIINSSQNPSDEEDYVVISGKHTFTTQRLAVFKKLQAAGLISSEEAVNKKIKPELVNLIPQSFRGRDDLRRRDISVR